MATGRWGLAGAAPPEEAGAVFRSDTGELMLRPDPGVFTVVSPCIRVATGFLGQVGAVELGDVTVECSTPFASVSVAALDGQTVAESQRLLLTAVARAENTGQAYLDDHSSIPERGRAPVLAEPVDAVVSVPSSGRMTAYALTPTGQRGKKLTVEQAEARASVSTLAAESPWILLVAE
jgi:hypothetical protein